MSHVCRDKNLLVHCMKSPFPFPSRAGRKEHCRYIQRHVESFRKVFRAHQRSTVDSSKSIFSKLVGILLIDLSKYSKKSHQCCVFDNKTEWDTFTACKTFLCKPYVSSYTLKTYWVVVGHIGRELRALFWKILTQKLIKILHLEPQHTVTNSK